MDEKATTPGAFVQTRRAGSSWMWDEWAAKFYYGTFTIKKTYDGEIVTIFEGRDPGKDKLVDRIDHSPMQGRN